MFYGYIFNSDEYLSFKIKKETAREAWVALMDLTDKVSDKYEDYRDIQQVLLLDENHDRITDLDSNIKKNIEEYDKKYEMKMKMSKKNVEEFHNSLETISVETAYKVLLKDHFAGLGKELTDEELNDLYQNTVLETGETHFLNPVDIEACEKQVFAQEIERE